MWIAILLASAALAQDTGQDYTDSRHHIVHFPLGDKSFADEVVAFNMGHPEPQPANARDPHNALGIPDNNDKLHSGFVTLGCGGSLTLRFTDNALVDVDGPDLWVFEVGPAVEPFEPVEPAGVPAPAPAPVPRLWRRRGRRRNRSPKWR